jgi:hypothetical protein
MALTDGSRDSLRREAVDLARTVFPRIATWYAS